MDKPLIEEEIKEDGLFCEICYDQHAEEMFKKIPECEHRFCEQSLQDFFKFQITESG